MLRPLCLGSLKPGVNSIQQRQEMSHTSSIGRVAAMPKLNPKQSTRAHQPHHGRVWPTTSISTLNAIAESQLESNESVDCFEQSAAGAPGHTATRCSVGTPSSQRSRYSERLPSASDTDCHLETLTANYERSKHEYRRRLSCMLGCTFSVLLVVASVACLVFVAMFVRNRSSRGPLVGLEGVLRMTPDDSVHRCARNAENERMSFQSDVVRTAKRRLDAVLGNFSLSGTTFAGSLIEDVTCVFRHSRGKAEFRVQLDFVAFWRRRPGSWGTLYRTRDLVRSVNNLVGALSEFEVELTTTSDGSGLF